MPTIADAKNAHQPGFCWCGWEHTVSDSVIHRARDLMRDDPTVSTEAVAHTLFEEFSELAKRDHVSDETLHQMTMAHALQMTEVRALVDNWKADGKETEKN